MDQNLPVISHFQAKVLLDCRASGASSTEISLDLGLTRTLVGVEPQGTRLPVEGVLLPWDTITAITADENGCYAIETSGSGEPSSARKIQFYSEATGRLYSLYPTAGAPTMLVSGIPMHRIKDTDPHQDTLEKIRTVKPVGNVLDTATGLGYTAIEASKTATHVTTIELEPVVIQVCRLNPWSQRLFAAPNITQIIGDSYDEVTKFENGSFTRIIHDPPVISLAGDLYSLEFYQELHRLLSRSGRLFHYVGDPDSKSGRNVTASVTRRLQQAGFQQVEKAPRAFGVVAHK
jgi:predicted methyltransferase